MSNYRHNLLQEFLLFVIVLGLGIALMSACAADLKPSPGNIPATATPQEHPPTPQPEPTATPTVGEEPGVSSRGDSGCLSVLGVLLIPALPFLRLIKQRN